MKNLHIIFCALLFSIHSSAQEVTNKDFNDLKRSNKYFYYEVNLEDRQKAREAAKANLIKLINDFYEKNAIDKNKVDDSTIKDVLFIEMDRNGVMKVMAYVDKERVTDSEKKSVKETINEKEVLVANEQVANSEEIVVPNTEIIIVERQTSATTASVPIMDKWQEKIISDICRASSANQVLSELADLKDQYKIKRFGVYGECNYINESFWVVYDSSKNVVAVLGPGDDSRYDFISKTNRTLEGFTSQGYKGIWFQLSK